MLKRLALTILAVLVIFEEWLWDMLTAAGQWLSYALNLQRFDETLARATPPQALLALFVPILIVTPINFMAVYLLINGAIVQGVTLEIVAKLLGTLLVARVFRLVRPALLTFSWLAKLYYAIIRLLQWAHALVHNSAIYQLSLRAKAAVKQQIGVFRLAIKRMLNGG